MRRTYRRRESFAACIAETELTILDELRQPNSMLTRAVLAMAQYQTSPPWTRSTTGDDGRDQLRA